MSDVFGSEEIPHELRDPRDPPRSSVFSFGEHLFGRSETRTHHYADGTWRRWVRYGDGDWIEQIADGDTITVKGVNGLEGQYRVAEANYFPDPYAPMTMRCERVSSVPSVPPPPVDPPTPRDQ